jgi:hypothetical protein
MMIPETDPTLDKYKEKKRKCLQTNTGIKIYEYILMKKMGLCSSGKIASLKFLLKTCWASSILQRIDESVLPHSSNGWTIPLSLLCGDLTRVACVTGGHFT